MKNYQKFSYRNRVGAPMFCRKALELFEVYWTQTNNAIKQKWQITESEITMIETWEEVGNILYWWHLIIHFQYKWFEWSIWEVTDQIHFLKSLYTRKTNILLSFGFTEEKHGFWNY